MNTKPSEHDTFDAMEVSCMEHTRAQELIAQLDSNLITEEECRTMIDNAVAEGITYAKNNKESTSERHVYMLLSGKQTIGKAGDKL